MNARIATIIAALLFAAGCVAQVGQPEEKTGTVRSTLGNGDPGDPPPDPGGGGGDQSGGDKSTSDPGNNSTSGDNQGPQPLPWTTTSTSGTGGTQQKK